MLGPEYPADAADVLARTILIPHHQIFAVAEIGELVDHPAGSRFIG